MPFRRPIALFTLTVLLAGCVNTASTVTTNYYSVSGTTSEELDRELRSKGPMEGHALAVAAISFAPVSVQQQITDRGCVFTEAKFKVNAEITLPRWRERGQSSDRQLRRSWDALAAYARAHEQVHVEIAEDYARRLGRQIEALDPEPSCEALDRAAAAVVRKLGRAHDAEQRAFDAAEQLRLAQLLRHGRAAER